MTPVFFLYCDTSLSYFMHEVKVLDETGALVCWTSQTITLQSCFTVTT